MLFRSSLFLILLTAALFFLTRQGLAAQQGQGRVTMQGEIIDTPCSIEAGDRNQSINMGSFPVAVMYGEGRSPVHQFSIRLTDCVLERPDQQRHDWKKFQVTFEGEPEGSLFALRGRASGIGLRISNVAGHIATSGQSLPTEKLSAGEMQLNFYLTLVRNNQPLVAGDYSTTLRFKLNYF